MKRNNLIRRSEYSKTNWAFVFWVDIFNVSPMCFDISVGFCSSLKAIIKVLLLSSSSICDPIIVHLFAKQVHYPHFPNSSEESIKDFDGCFWIFNESDKESCNGTTEEKSVEPRDVVPHFKHKPK